MTVKWNDGGLLRGKVTNEPAPRWLTSRLAIISETQGSGHLQPVSLLLKHSQTLPVDSASLPAPLSSPSPPSGPGSVQKEQDQEEEGKKLSSCGLDTSIVKVCALPLRVSSLVTPDGGPLASLSPTLAATQVPPGSLWSLPLSLKKPCPLRTQAVDPHLS